MPLDLSSQNCREHSYKPPSQVKCASIQSKVLGHMNWSSIAERKKKHIKKTNKQNNNLFEEILTIAAWRSNRRLW